MENTKEEEEKNRKKIKLNLSKSSTTSSSINKKNNEDHDDEDDYMSNDFLNQIEDTRPGLVFSRKVARQYEVEKKHQIKTEENNVRNQMQSAKVIEKMNREEALKKSTLSEENKGFSLMLKMGYKTGKGLGRAQLDNQSTNETQKRNQPIIEPLSFKIKNDRVGLGQQEEEKRKKVELIELRKTMEINRTKTAEEYLNKKKNLFKFRKLLHSLHKSQRICFQLDSQILGLKEPEKKFFWPLNITNTKTKEEKLKENDTKNIENFSESNPDEFLKESETETENETKLDLKQVFNERLETFLNEGNDSEKQTNDKSDEDESDENDEFGNEYHVKARSDMEKSEDERLSDDEEEEEDSEEQITKKTLAICSYLRTKFAYCVWCALRYDNQEDLLHNCPGIDEESHE